MFSSMLKAGVAVPCLVINLMNEVYFYCEAGTAGKSHGRFRR